MRHDCVEGAFRASTARMAAAMAGPLESVPEDWPCAGASNATARKPAATKGRTKAAKFVALPPQPWTRSTEGPLPMRKPRSPLPRPWRSRAPRSAPMQRSLWSGVRLRVQTRATLAESEKPPGPRSRSPTNLFGKPNSANTNSFPPRRVLRHVIGNPHWQQDFSR